jgi:hypothetical protein
MDMGSRPHGSVSVPKARIALTLPMNALNKSKKSSCPPVIKTLTFGDLISATYSECGELLAPKILQLAFASNLVQLKRVT